MKRVAILLVVVALAGCTSGIARYSAEPVMLNGEPVCCKVNVANGKEIGHLKLHMEKRDGFWMLDLEETNVEAFRGQEIAAGAARSISSTAAKTAAAVAIAPLALPAAGAALASPGLGAAALGAGALAAGQELAGK